MFTKNNLIIGSIVLGIMVVLGGSNIVGNVFQSPEKAAAEMQRKAAEAHEKARKATCSYIGQLTNECYNGDAGACMRMNDKEDDFRANYEIAVYEPGGCVMFDQDIPVKVEDTIAPAGWDEAPSSAASSDPVFFGDEEATESNGKY